MGSTDLGSVNSSLHVSDTLLYSALGRIHSCDTHRLFGELVFECFLITFA